MRNKLAVMLLIAMMATPAFAMPVVKSTEIDDVPVWFVEDDTLPVVHMVLTFTGAGTASDPEDRAGRAMMAANLLSEGAGQMDALAFHTALESRAIGFSAQAQRDDLVVSLHTLKEALPDAMRLLTLALSAPRFDEKALAVAQQEQIAALRMRAESPTAIASRAWAKRFYGAHPYGRDGMGDEASVNALRASDMGVFRERYMSAANLQVSVAGDMSRAEIKDALAPLIEALPQSFFPELDLPGVSAGGAGETQHITHAGPQSVVWFGGAGISRDDKRYYAYYLMNEALGGGGLTSQFMRDVRVKKGLVYGVGTWLAHGQAADSFAGQLATGNDTVDAAIAEVKASAKRMAEKGLSQRTCDEVKRNVVSSFALKLDSTTSIANVVAMMQRFNLGRDYMKRRADYFESVGCDDIQAAAKELLTPEQWLFVVVGGAPAAKDK